MKEGEQKSERNTKTQQSHLVLLQVTTVQVSCVSDLWDPGVGTGKENFEGFAKTEHNICDEFRR